MFPYTASVQNYSLRKVIKLDNINHNHSNIQKNRRIRDGFTLFPCRTAKAGFPAAHESIRLRLLPSGPDLVHRLPLRRTRLYDPTEKQIYDFIKKAAQCGRFLSGGERGIRTLGTVSRTHAFQACTFNHSVISPRLKTLNYFQFASTIRTRS